MADIPIAPTAEITQDTPCAQCGYNLRGLTPAGLCPECGIPITRSIFGNQLRYANPDWLEKLRFGTALKLWSIALAILLAAGAAVLIGAVGLDPIFIVAATVVSSAVGFWGVWLITYPEPRVMMQEDPVTLRKVVRFCAVMAFVGTLLQQSSSFSLSTRTDVLVIIGMAISLAGIVQYFGELVYYRRFVRRVPDEKLERSTTIVLWGLPISYGVMAIGGLIMVLTMLYGYQSGPGTSAAIGGGAVMCFAGVAVLVFFLWYIRLLYAYRNAFANARDHAEQFVAPTTQSL